MFSEEISYTINNKKINIMKNGIKQYLTFAFKKVMPSLLNKLIDVHVIKSYSQEGEDMILRRIFEGQENGFYVDVGAHHPRRFSNTYYFYKQGWKGINIEPNPDALKAFNSDRPKDVNLQLGVSDAASILKYYYFDEPALNTFDSSIVKSRLADTPYKLIKTEDVAVDRLDSILKKHLPCGQSIDFLSVDVEGLDLAVLRSSDWHLFRPKCVLAEALNMTLDEAIKSDIALFMFAQGYILFARTYNTLIFCDKTK
jgi:FkbM family methyltransferase